MSKPLSSVFRFHKKLVDCQNFDQAHIGLNAGLPQNRKGVHVQLIKKALNVFAAKRGMDLLDETNPVFDQETEDMVLTFKELHKPPILNFRGEIDPVVGKKTITFLDDELPFQAPKPGFPR
jgi:hypothetical protein